MNIGDIFLGTTGPGQSYFIGEVVQMIIAASLAIAGLVVLFYFVMGGFMVIKGAGNDDPQSSAKGKQAITSAAIGFILVFTAYWIIRIIEIIVGSNFITGLSI